MILRLVVGLAAMATLVSAQSLPLRWEIDLGANNNRHFQDLTGLDDVNGDGIEDFCVTYDNQNGLAANAEVRSGVDGSVITTILRPTAVLPTNSFGLWSQAVDDLNGDGIGDLAIHGLALNPMGPVIEDVLYFIDPVSGLILNSYVLPGSVSPSGAPLVVIPDLNGDGCDDVAIATNLFTMVSAPYVLGRTDIVIIDPKTSQKLGSRMGHDRVFGESTLVGTPDLNMDGIPDFVLFSGGPFDVPLNTPSDFCGQVLCGASLDEIGTSYAVKAGVIESSVIGFIGDTNLDGITEVAIQSIDAMAMTETVEIINVNDGSVVGSETFAHNATRADQRTCSALGDIDGDQIADWSMLLPYKDPAAYPGGGPSELSVWSGNTVPRFDRWLFGLPSSQISAIERLGEVTGDGVGDYLITDGNHIRLISIGGSLVYGAPAQALDLNWTSNGFTGLHFGTIRVTGAAPFAAGLSGVSLAPGSSQISGLDIFISLDPADLVIVADTGFDGTGTLEFSFSIHIPALVGFNFYFQTLDPTVLPIKSSRGLEIRFVN